MRCHSLLLPLVVAIIGLGSGCASPESRWGGTSLLTAPDGPAVEPAKRLSSDLLRLAPTVDPREADMVSLRAVQYSAQLAAYYRAVRPAWLQNHLVNAGRRERGLCFQWMLDLHAALKPLSPATLDFHFAVAREGTSREHNALVVSAHGVAMESGLVLDPWRRSGRLVWAPFTGDKYPWTHPTNEVGNAAVSP